MITKGTKYPLPGTYSPWDVVLPLPGASVQLPQHATGDVYREMAAAVLGPEGRWGDPAPHRAKEFSLAGLTGDYRHLLQRPRGLRYELIRCGGFAFVWLLVHRLSACVCG